MKNQYNDKQPTVEWEKNKKTRIKEAKLFDQHKKLNFTLVIVSCKLNISLLLGCKSQRKRKTIVN